MPGWLGAITRVAGAAGAANARGVVAGQEQDADDLKELVAQAAKQRQLDLEQQRVTGEDRYRTDQNRWHEDDVRQRGIDRDADRTFRENESRANRQMREQEFSERRRDRAESRVARTDLRPDQLTNAQADFADQYVQATGGDPIAAMLAAERDKAGATRLGMKASHYHAAAQRFKDRFTSKTGTGTGTGGGLGKKYAVPPTATGDTSGTKPPISAAEAAKLRARGWSPADISAKFTVGG
jgi:hypothetical protein